jgi:hypothetical protein
MWRDLLVTTPQARSLGNKTLNCAQCPDGLVKYIEFFEFPSRPLRFFVDRVSSPADSGGLIQAHYWSAVPNSSAPPENREWIADVIPGGSFLFQPTPTNRYISLYKLNNAVSSFDAICFRYLSQSRTFVPQVF